MIVLERENKPKSRRAIELTHDILINKNGQTSGEKRSDTDLYRGIKIQKEVKEEVEKEVEVRVELMRYNDASQKNCKRKGNNDEFPQHKR